MARTKGSLTLGSNLEPRMSAPLDARTVVNTKADLTDNGSYPYSYVGMIVSVKDEGQAYILTATPTTVAANWTLLGGGADNVVEGYYNEADGLFYKESTYTTAITGALHTIYISVDTNLTYRWDGTDFIPIKAGSDNVVEGYRNTADGLFYKETTYTTAIPGAATVIYIDLPNNKSYRWDGTEFVRLDEGQTTQYTTMPTASSDNVGDVIQYIGATTTTAPIYTKGYFYECVEDTTTSPSTFSWEQVDVQPETESVIIEGYYNTTDGLFYEESTYTTAITGERGKMYVSLDTEVTYRWTGVKFERLDKEADEIIWGYRNSTDGLFYEDNLFTTAITGEAEKQYVALNEGLTYLYDGTDFVRLDKETIQISIMPTASADNVGEIYQYIGATTATYINGYFYKCVEDSTTTPSTYSWENVDVQTGGGVVEGYYNDTDGLFYEDNAYTIAITGESGIEYISVDTNYVYRWDGTAFININTLSKELTQTEYDALPISEKTNGTVYYIKDGIAANQRAVNCGYTPVGTIISLMGNTAPRHYLVCDGQTVNINDYPTLAEYIEDQFGTVDYFGGDGTTTFAVPDLRGEFLRGTGTNSHTYQGSGEAVGTHQDATTVPTMYTNADSTGIGMWTEGSNKGFFNNAEGGKPTVDYLYFNKTASGAQAQTYGMKYSRPTNTSVLYCIAVCDIYVDARFDYSTSEKVVGTWIDGKPIYQKSYNCGTLMNAGQLNYDHNIANIDKAWVESGFAVTTDGSVLITIPQVNPQFLERSIHCSVDKNNIYIITGTDRSDFIGYVTIRYTKTTD